MEKINLLERISSLYDRGENIISYLKQISNNNKNSIEDILISYDFQAGTYTEFAKNNIQYLNSYTTAIAETINKLGAFNSILEAGVGEATTIGNLVKKLSSIKDVFGFDLSWSRIKFGNKYLEDNSINKFCNVNLFVGDLFNIPLADNSIDVVYTSHSIEPNGGREAEALEALYRVAKNFLVLLEPSYNFASAEGKERMINNGYITTLYDTAKSLNYNIIEYRLFDIFNNDLNPTELIVIKKSEQNLSENNFHFQCPNTKTRLSKKEDCFYSNTGLIAYPIIDSIPCLLPNNGIVATKYNDFH